MKNSFENRDCAHCEHSSEISEEDKVLCPWHGVVMRSDSCRRFSLDLLKVEPGSRVLPHLDADGPGGELF